MLSEDDAFVPHEPDHVIAVKHGGAAELGNLALACFDCNRFKGSDIASIDPATGALTSLFHPRIDPWRHHFRAHEGRIEPISAVGRVTARLLRLNLASRIEVRRELGDIGRWP